MGHNSIEVKEGVSPGVYFLIAVFPVRRFTTACVLGVLQFFGARHGLSFRAVGIEYCLDHEVEEDGQTDGREEDCHIFHGY